MGELSTIDARMQAALARLTNNEKECLRRRLQQQTAKEMALDLGVSPHAVEKRLKMARTKLGLSSSLEAARLLAASEEYQRTVPQTPDLAGTVPSVQNGHRRPLAWGAFIMLMLSAAAIAFAMQPSPETPTTADAQRIRFTKIGWVEASPETVKRFVTENFTMFDRNRSGAIEQFEVPGPGLVMGDSMPDYETMSQAEIDEGRRRWIAMGDSDGDRRVNLEEYLAWHYPAQLNRGVPANWRGLMQTAPD